MNVKKFEKIMSRVRNGKIVSVREFSSVISYLGGNIVNNTGSIKKVYLNGKIASVHWHNENDFVRRDTWKSLELK